MEKEIYFAGGCFWGTEHFFKQIEGVIETEVGFANGHIEDPTYKEVYTDETGHAETVRVKYDPEVASLEFLVRMFFKAIDPQASTSKGMTRVPAIARASIIQTTPTFILLIRCMPRNNKTTTSPLS